MDTAYVEQVIAALRDIQAWHWGIVAVALGALEMLFSGGVLMGAAIAAALTGAAAFAASRYPEALPPNLQFGANVQFLTFVVLAAVFAVAMRLGRRRAANMIARAAQPPAPPPPAQPAAPAAVAPAAPNPMGEPVQEGPLSIRPNPPPLVPPPQAAAPAPEQAAAKPQVIPPAQPAARSPAVAQPAQTKPPTPGKLSPQPPPQPIVRPAPPPPPNRAARPMPSPAAASPITRLAPGQSMRVSGPTATTTPPAPARPAAPPPPAPGRAPAVAGPAVKPKQNPKDLLGKEYTLWKPIEGGKGSLRIAGVDWKLTGPDLAAGARVRVSGIEGLDTLRVTPI